MKTPIEYLPEDFKNDIDIATKMLREIGCTEIYLFGSLAEGGYRENSDIDFAVKGCPPEDYFNILGNLLCTLKHSINLIRLDRNDPFSKFLEQKGILLHVA